MTVPLGSPQNPLSDEALLLKFQQLALRVLPAQQTAALEAYCLTLEQQTDMQELLNLLTVH